MDRLFIFKWTKLKRSGKASSVGLLHEDYYHQQQNEQEPVEHADDRINPFSPLDGDLGGPPIPPYEWFKIVVTGPILLAVRLVLCLPIFLLVILLARITVIGAKISDPEHDAPPFGKWRLFMCLIIRILMRAFLFICGFYWIPVTKDPGSRLMKAPIMISNHVCLFDAIIYMALYHASPIAITDTAKTPIFGSASKALQTIYVDRLAKNSSQYVKDEILRRSTPGSGFPPVFIFPEGVCKDNTCLVRFRLGAFSPGQPIQPLVIRYPWRFFNPAWSQSGYHRQIRILCQFVNHATIDELPIYYPNEEEKVDPVLYADNVRDAMARHMQLPVTDHTVQDTVLMLDALQLQVELGGTQFTQLKRLDSNMDLKQSRDLLKVFKAMDTSQTGTVGYNDFCKALKLPPDYEMAEHIFDMMDMDGSGQLDYSEFVYGINVLLMRCKTTNDYIDTSFGFYDADGDGLISLEEVEMAFSKLEGLYASSILSSPRQKRGHDVEEVLQRREALVNEFKALDNGSGKIDKTGFKQLFMTIREGHQQDHV